MILCIYRSRVHTQSDIRFNRCLLCPSQISSRYQDFKQLLPIQQFDFLLQKLLFLSPLLSLMLPLHFSLSIKDVFAEESGQIPRYIFWPNLPSSPHQGSWNNSKTSRNGQNHFQPNEVNVASDCAHFSGHTPYTWNIEQGSSITLDKVEF